MIRRAVAIPAVTLVAGAASAQMPVDFVPPEFQNVGHIDRRGEQIPLDLEFADETGKMVALSEYFQDGKPVILTLVYYQCPMLCNLTLNGLTDGLQQLEWSAGDEFKIVTVSFNHEEKTKLAEVKRRAYLAEYDRPGAERGWHFHTSDEASVRALANAVGFTYKKDEQTGEYAHPSTVTFLTPDGRVSTYLDDVVFEPKDLRLALYEASEGSIGSALEAAALFFCFQYDPTRNSYVIEAWKIMRGFAMLIMVVVGCGLCVLWFRESRPTATAHAGTES